MKIHCPHCQSFFKAPGTYEGRPIKCPVCKQVFLAARYRRPPLAVPGKVARFSGSLVGKLWYGCPLAFRTAFLATCGVIAALALSLLLYAHLFLRPVRPASGNVILTKYEFQHREDLSNALGHSGQAIAWTAWVENSTHDWVYGHYTIELRDAHGVMVRRFPPEPASFPNSAAPRQAGSICWVPDPLFPKVDLERSRITITIY